MKRVWHFLLFLLFLSFQIQALLAGIDAWQGWSEDVFGYPHNLAFWAITSAIFIGERTLRELGITLDPDENW